LVFIGDDLVVYRRDNKAKLFPLHIDLPGGGPENNETPFETFQREVQEEFSVTVQKSDIIYVRKYPSKLEVGKYAYFPVAKLSPTVEAKIKLGNEGLEYMRMPLNTFLRLDDVWPGLQEKS
jgi:8-oxo-dGTP diphosphatase